MIYTQDIGRPLTNDEADYNLESIALRLKQAGATMPVTLRRDLTRPLTNREVDANFQSLDQYTREILYGNGPYPVLDQVFGGGASRLDPRITLTRPGPSTYIDDEGVLRTAGPDEPVFEDGAWRLRPQETNLARVSEDLTSGYWLPSHVTFAVNAGIAPNGEQTADRLIATALNQQHGVTQNLSGVAPGKYTVSAFVAQAEYGYAFVWYDNGSGKGTVVEVNLSTGEARITHQDGDYSDRSFKVKKLKHGGWRVSITATTTYATVGLRVYMSPAPFTTGSLGTPVFAGDGVSGIYVWGGQINAGDLAPYIPTTTSQVTRPADNTGIFGDAFTEVFNPEQGAIVLDLSAKNWIIGFPAVLSLNTTSDFLIRLYKNPQDNYSMQVRGAAGKGITTTGNVNGPVIAAVVWGGGKPIEAWFNGGLSTASFDMFDLSGANRLFLTEAGVSSERTRLRIFRARPSDSYIIERLS